MRTISDNSKADWVIAIKHDEKVNRLQAIDQGVCKECGEGHYHFNAYCGADVCNKCGDHKRLAMCYCGWKSGGGRATELDFAENGESMYEEEY